MYVLYDTTVIFYSVKYNIYIKYSYEIVDAKVIF